MRLGFFGFTFLVSSINLSNGTLFVYNGYSIEFILPIDQFGDKLRRLAVYAFFKADAEPYPETIDTMEKLKQYGMKIGILTDVAYGMDNVFSLEDISVLSDFIDIAITSVDVGYRKPNSAGYLKLLESLEIYPNDMLFIGDEEKDIIGARKLGIVSALINRSKEIKDFGQDYTLESLSDIFSILHL